MVDEVGVVKGLRGYGIKEEFAHAKSATAAMGAENVSTLCQMSKCGAGEGEELVFIRGLYDVVPNVEMCELGKEMDKDGRVVFRVRWTIR
jgi:hypothetical protein